MSSAPALTVEKPSNEQPLPAARHGWLLFCATLLMLVFYLYSALFLLVASLLCLVVSALGASVKAFARGLRLGRGIDFHLSLAREEAPLLWEEIEALSRRLGVAVPDELVLENSANAYVWLRGLVAGRGRTRLGIGFDLLAGLSPAQTRAVVAHEIAHAKWVRRGYQGFLMRGLARVSRCAGALGAIAEHQSNPKSVRLAARVSGAWPRVTARIAGKMIAVCSRYDEFTADRVAAEICGKAAMRSALLAIEIVAQQSDKIDYRERLLHLGREGDYAQWLRQRLSVADEDKRVELESRALERNWRHERATHPALADRLAAIDALTQNELPVQDEGDCGLDWMEDANASGAQLLRSIELRAAAQEAKSSQSLAKWMRKREREQSSVARVQSKRFGAVFLTILGAGLSVQMWQLGRDVAATSGAPFGLALVLVELMPLVILVSASEMWIKSLARTRELPIPPFSLYCANRAARYDERMAARTQLVERQSLSDAQKRVLEAADDDEISRENIARGAQLRALTAHLTKPAAIANFRVEQAYRALEKLDIVTAAHWARLIFELDPARGEAFLVRYVCSAARGWRGQGNAHAKTIAGQHGFGGRWALAWIACLEEETVLGEAMLLELVRSRPDDATLLALLGLCQLKNGKPREALATRQRALASAQRNRAIDETTALSEEACHRHTLAFSLMVLGQLAPARVQLDWVAEQRARLEARGEKLVGTDQFHVDAMELDWQVGHGHAACALEIAERMVRARPQAKTHIDVAESLGEGDEPQLRAAAQTHFERALEHGFYPRAKLALARLAYDRDDKMAARQLSLESINTTHRREHDSNHPLLRLDNVVQFLRALDQKRPEKVVAWELTLDATNLNMGVSHLLFLCLTPDEASARNAASEIIAAIKPGQNWDERIAIQRAATQYQTEEPMSPGVYNARWKE